MELEHSVSLPVPVAEAWDLLLNVDRIAPCLPGATVESFDGQVVEGRAKMKLGPIQVSYIGTATFVERDASDRRIVVEAKATETRGVGTVLATIVVVLEEAGPDRTRVAVTTDLTVTGRPAQFGRGVMVEVGNRLLHRFTDCLLAQRASGAWRAVQPAVTPPLTTPGRARPQLGALPAAEPPRPDTAHPVPALRRLAPVAAALVGLLVVRWLARRRR